MQPLTRDDLLDIAQYERERDEYRARIIEHKNGRRVGVGDLVTLIFENRDTVRFQVQEMMRAKRIVIEERVQEELDTYNELIPGANELKATLLVEITDQARLREELDRFMGLDRGGTTYLLIGRAEVEGEFEGGRSHEAKISAVHFVTFTLTPDQAADFLGSDAPVSVRIEHGDYRHETELAGSVRASLADDLRSG